MMDAVLRKQQQLIEQYGWTAVAVFDAHPQWIYSIGFRGLGHPDVLVVGMPTMEAGHGFLQMVYARVQAGERFVPDTRYAEFIDGYDVMFRPVHPTNRAGLCGVAASIYQTNDFGVLQLVPPDKNKLFPWESGCSEGFKQHVVVYDQPNMYKGPNK